jgi:hypothetical protein
LRRIAYQGERAPRLDVLCAVHQQHMLNIPFENLDICWADLDHHVSGCPFQQLSSQGLMQGMSQIFS